MDRPGSLMLDDTGRSHQSSRTKADILIEVK
jgi:hypothetical protein